MKPLLAIFTCHQYRYTLPEFNIRDWFTRPPAVDRVAGVRDSWLKDVTCDYKLFYGRGTGRLPQPDEVFLDAPDDYLHSADKLRGIIKYALVKGYDHLLKVDDDVFLYWDRVMANVPTADYVGSTTGPVAAQSTDKDWWKSTTAEYCSGMTYWLSKKAMQALSTSRAGSWAEDRWAGESLRRVGIRATIDPRYYIAPYTRTNPYISEEELAKPNDHLAIHALTPDQMRRLYSHELITRGREGA